MAWFLWHFRVNMCRKGSSPHPLTFSQRMACLCSDRPRRTACLHRLGANRLCAPSLTTISSTPSPISSGAKASTSHCGRNSLRCWPSSFALMTVSSRKTNDSNTCGPTSSAHHLMQAFFARAQASIERYGGRIIHYGGDDSMALFGAPVLYEDHARWAVLAAFDPRKAQGQMWQRRRG